jgi:alkylhydroperoxidase/carboxymuconolactone decarboxylase family protein YurZ
MGGGLFLYPHKFLFLVALFLIAPRPTQTLAWRRAGQLPMGWTKVSLAYRARSRTVSMPMANPRISWGSDMTEAIDIVREWDPAKAEAYLKVNTNPWKNGVLDIKTIELICVGLNVSCTNLQSKPTRRHIRAALEAGATRNEILLVIEGAAFMSIHACSLGAPILLEEGKAAGKTPALKDAATPSADAMKAKGLWNTAWDPFFNLDPLWTDQFFAAVGGIYDGKTLQPKFVELLSIALDASVTHMYAPGTRRHIKGALALGASMEEIMETLKIATCFGQETINMAIPILAEEIAAFEKKK